MTVLFKTCISNSLAKISSLVPFQDLKPNLSRCLSGTPAPPASTRLHISVNDISSEKHTRLGKLLFSTFTLFLQSVTEIISITSLHLSYPAPFIPILLYSLLRNSLTLLQSLLYPPTDTKNTQGIFSPASSLLPKKVHN